MTEGTINQISIPVSDLKQAQQFYSTIFDWKIDAETYYPNYAAVKWDNQMDLGFYPVDEIKGGGPMLIFSVSDIDLFIERLLEVGGEVLREKHRMSTGEFGVVFRDIFGNRFRAQGMSKMGES